MRVEQLRVAVYVHFNLAGIVEKRGLPLLHGQSRKQIVGHERYRVLGKVAVRGRGHNRAVDGLGHQGNGTRQGVGVGAVHEIVRRNIYILARDDIRHVKGGNERQQLQIINLTRYLEDSAVYVVRP